MFPGIGLCRGLTYVGTPALQRRPNSFGPGQQYVACAGRALKRPGYAYIGRLRPTGIRSLDGAEKDGTTLPGSVGRRAAASTAFTIITACC